MLEKTLQHLQNIFMHHHSYKITYKNQFITNLHYISYLVKTFLLEKSVRSILNKTQIIAGNNKPSIIIAYHFNILPLPQADNIPPCATNNNPN